MTVKHSPYLEAIVRTIERVCALRRMGISDENIAKALAPTAANLQYARDILSDLWELVSKLRPSDDEKKCLGCDEDVLNWRNRADARYCSKRCKQKAYRKRQKRALRIKGHPRTSIRNEAPERYGSPGAGDPPTVTAEVRK